jgi:hypothetical protein
VLGQSTGPKTQEPKRTVLENIAPAEHGGYGSDATVIS